MSQLSQYFLFYFQVKGVSIIKNKILDSENYIDVAIHTYVRSLATLNILKCLNGYTFMW